MKAFLGMGLLGSNFVKAMIKKGDQVQVWNRNPSRAEALQTYGAKAFADVAQAVKGATTIHLTLKDDASVDEVLKLASKGFANGTTIIDHTTTSVKGAIERTAYWKGQGFTYLHAPVFMGPPNALESTGYMLVSGDQDIIGKVQPELEKMTGKVINFGPQEGKAAGMKLTGNLFLITLTAGITDTLAFAKAIGISSNDVSTLFESWNPGAGMPARLKKIAAGDFKQPSWELNMARKDAGLMQSAAEQSDVKLTLIPVIIELMDSWISKGHGNDDWSVIATDAVS
ncbi:NAD(P)-dependent oxidoreductase [Mucilaginibacter aquaedulcis]|uniref:NAD(P)-dependent oxidoreductase n=1 Tax=Mucilaginibacter aquaedulcis TaxID=1187081 RepID=UPI0025B3FFD8|nr:NAD(P)-dependent oxidoreductase [Mucilaginibacter aquaedulcis]MDN3548192.1 NAD(P)-dependent oxidoreductase [Mucilaginibacter aquaedulcis]